MRKAFCLTVLLAGSIFGQSGGVYEIERSVISPGGTTAGGDYSLSSTIAQNSVGPRQFGGRYFVQSGFWTRDLAPTAATVAVSGRVRSAFGPVDNAIVMLADMAGGSRFARTNPFGFFRIEGINAGQVYIVSISSKGLIYTPIAISVTDEISDLEIEPVNEK